MRLPIAAALLVLSACSRTTEGPTPKVTETTNPRQRFVHPARVCNAQGGERGWRIELSGENFAPMPQGVLTDAPRMVLPTVTLKGGSSTTLPAENVLFEGDDLLRVDVPTTDSTPAVTLAPGMYAVEVRNPTGGTGELAEALVVVAPPTLTRVTAPNGFNAAEPSPLVIEGTAFQPGTAPALVLRGADGTEQPLSTFTVVSETRIDAELPTGTPEGTYALVITNPEGCAFTLPDALTITYARLGTLSIEPRFGWARRDQPVTLYNVATGAERPFSGGSPEVYLLAPQRADPSRQVAIPLQRVAFVSPSVITAVVPTCTGDALTPDATCARGVLEGGPYRLRVVDPSGSVGEVPEARGFTVVAEEPPTITALNPSAIDTGGLLNASNPLVVTGTHFGIDAEQNRPPRVQLLQQLASGNIRACDLPSTGTPTSTEVRALVPRSIPATSCVETTPVGTPVAATAGLTLAPGLYVVRVQNTRDPAYADYSGLIVTNPAANPAAGPATTTRLATARANFPLVLATNDLGQPFLYALGGTNGTTALASVEVAPVTLFGDLGGDCTASGCTFRALERTPLGVGTAGTTPEPRQGLTAFVRTVPGDTSYLFALGGAGADGVAVRTVERAQVLKTSDAPVLAPPERLTEEGASLPAGTLYYRVSALLGASDARNPGGETLPSDEYPVKPNAALNAVRLTWTCVPGAATYRVYRTAQPNQPSGSERLLDEVPAPECAGATRPTVTYVDTGAKTPAAEAPAPLPPGALGRWVRLGTGLAVERGNAATRLVGNRVYVTGGFCSTPSANCPAANAATASVEFAAFPDDTSIEPGGFQVGGTLTQARQRHSLAVASAATAPSSFTSTSPDNRQAVWLLAVGGDTGGAPLGANVIEAGQVQVSGTLINFAPASYNTLATHGGWAEVIANYLFQAGSTGGAGFAFRSGFVCPGTGNDPGQCTGTADFRGSLNNTALGYQQGGPRYLAGTTLFRAFIYAAGGLPNDAGGTPTSTIERIIY